MATVRKLERIELERQMTHTEVEATFSVVTDVHGLRMLQVDTYGSTGREMPSKKSQSIRFAPEAIEQLRTILSNEF